MARLERFVWPEIGSLALCDVKPANVLEIIEPRRKTAKTAEGGRAIIQQVYNYAIQKLLVEVNPALPLHGVIEVQAAEHHRHLNEAGGVCRGSRRSWRYAARARPAPGPTRRSAP